MQKNMLVALSIQPLIHVSLAEHKIAATHGLAVLINYRDQLCFLRKIKFTGKLPTLTNIRKFGTIHIAADSDSALQETIAKHMSHLSVNITIEQGLDTSNVSLCKSLLKQT